MQESSMYVRIAFDHQTLISLGSKY